MIAYGASIPAQGAKKEAKTNADSTKKAVKSGKSKEEKDNG